MSNADYVSLRVDVAALYEWTKKYSTAVKAARTRYDEKHPAAKKKSVRE